MSVSAEVVSPGKTPDPMDGEVEQYLQLGLRNRWYPILPSHMVTDRPVPIKRLGEKLVLWRDYAGQVHVQQDRCPHRAVPLSIGVNEGDRLRCIYHGIEIGPDGTVLKVPGDPGCFLEGKQLVKTYRTMEVSGAIFAWFGDALHPEPIDYTPPIQLQDGPYEAFLCYYEWPVPWRYIYDNNMDPMHGAFLHAKSYTMFQGNTGAKFHVKKTDTGFIFEKTDQKNVNFDWSEWCDSGAIYCRFDIPYPPSAGPGGNFTIIFHGTPIDEHTVAGFSWRCRYVQGWQRDAWRFLYRTRLEARHWAVLEQDGPVLMQADADARNHEMLYSHDVGLARMRRAMETDARGQLRALRDAGITT